MDSLFRNEGLYRFLTSKRVRVTIYMKKVIFFQNLMNHQNDFKCVKVYFTLLNKF